VKGIMAAVKALIDASTSGRGRGSTGRRRVAIHVGVSGSRRLRRLEVLRR